MPTGHLGTAHDSSYTPTPHDARTCLFLGAILGAAMGEAMGHGLRRQLPLLLAFGGAFLLGLCFLHLLPEAFAANGRAGL